MAVSLETLGSPRSHPNFPVKGYSGTGTVCGPAGQWGWMDVVAPTGPKAAGCHHRGDRAEAAQRCLVSWCHPWHHSAIPEHPAVTCSDKVALSPWSCSGTRLLSGAALSLLC